MIDSFTGYSLLLLLTWLILASVMLFYLRNGSLGENLAVTSQPVTLPAGPEGGFSLDRVAKCRYRSR